MKRANQSLIVPFLIVFLRIGNAPAGTIEAETLEIETLKNISYGIGGDDELMCDLARPKQSGGPWPAIVCIHGGGWNSGSRDRLLKMAEEFAGHGYVAITVSYRLAPAHPFPACVEDVKTAVRFLRARADVYHVDADYIGAMGFSAGGHLALMLGLTDAKDDLKGTGGYASHSSRVQAVVDFFGPTHLADPAWNMLPNQTLTQFIGSTFSENREAYKRASPITYVTKDDAPVLIFHGTVDRTVPIAQSELLEKKLMGVGIECKLVRMKGMGHGWGGTMFAKSMAGAIGFFDRHLKNGKPKQSSDQF
jgi:acetyl esterase/lipase